MHAYLRASVSVWEYTTYSRVEPGFWKNDIWQARDCSSPSLKWVIIVSMITEQFDKVLLNVTCDCATSRRLCFARKWCLWQGEQGIVFTEVSVSFVAPNYNLYITCSSCLLVYLRNYIRSCRLYPQDSAQGYTCLGSGSLPCSHAAPTSIFTSKAYQIRHDAIQSECASSFTRKTENMDIFDHAVDRSIRIQSTNFEQQDTKQPQGPEQTCLRCDWQDLGFPTPGCMQFQRGDPTKMTTSHQS